MAYEIGKIPLESLIGPIAQATGALVRLDERIARSPVRQGWIERSHFHDAAAALWIEGELVHLEDLVFHDAHMDQRTPTHELTRAHAVVRKRRRILSQPRDWAFGREGLRELTGQQGEIGTIQSEDDREGEGSVLPGAEPPVPANSPDDDLLAQEFAEIDALLARSSKVLSGAEMPPRRLPQDDDRLSVLYDQDWDEAARLSEWREMLDRSRHVPVVLRVALALDAWNDIDVLERGAWVGPLLMGALMRQEGLAAHHLPCLHLGAKNIPRERRRARNRSDRLLAWIDAMYEAASAGLKEHDRLLLAKGQMERVLRGRRASSKLPALLDLVLSRPLVSTSMIQDALEVSRQGALDLIGALHLREMTGRGSFRAWGIL
ncbi:RHE_PE00001 family protein [Mesorhizobium sp. M0910]|uniref:RHE_PE00001 family protein n=1 Tax=Mesorhizobium sp. M0910 TaxID=2957025 RepID=UPI00333D23F0